MEEKMLHRPTQAERLGQFAAAHFWISIAGAVAAMTVGLLLVEAVGDFEVILVLIAVAAFILMIAYGTAGVRAARVCGWSRPKHAGEGALAFLFPALIAWGWGSLVLCFYFLPGPEWSELRFLLVAVSMIAAFPSSLAVFCSLGVGFLDGGLLNMIVCMLLVGGLPPLLFVLGSVLGVRKENADGMQQQA